MLLIQRNCIVCISITAENHRGRGRRVGGRRREVIREEVGENEWDEEGEEEWEEGEGRGREERVRGGGGRGGGEGERGREAFFQV